MTELDTEIRQQASEYLTGELAFDDFEAWFVSATWDQRTALAAEVDLLLAERETIGFEAFNVGLRTAITIVEFEPRTGFATGTEAVTHEFARSLASRTIIVDLALAGR